MVALGERRVRTVPAGGPGAEMLDDRPDTQRPGQLMGQEGDRTVDGEILQSRADRHHIEVDNAAESVVGDEQHRTVEGVGFDVDLQPVVAADELDHPMPDRVQRGLDVLTAGVHHLLHRAEYRVGELVEGCAVLQLGLHTAI